MPYIDSAFTRRLLALERAEAGRHGRPLADPLFARVALSRRLGQAMDASLPDPALMSRGPGLLFQG